MPFKCRCFSVQFLLIFFFFKNCCTDECTYCINKAKFWLYYHCLSLILNGSKSETKWKLILHTTLEGFQFSKKTLLTALTQIIFSELTPSPPLKLTVASVTPHVSGAPHPFVFVCSHTSCMSSLIMSSEFHFCHSIRKTTNVAQRRCRDSLGGKCVSWAVRNNAHLDFVL